MSPRARPRLVLGLASACLSAALCQPLPGAAQTTAPSVRAPGVHVTQRAGATLVAVTIVLPTGSAADPRDWPGTARLTAETAAESARAHLALEAARLEVRVERGWTAFTLVAEPEGWARSWDALEEALFRLPMEARDLERARGRLVQSLAFAAGAPVREFERELYRVLVGAADPWSRDPRGMAAALTGVTPELLSDFRDLHYRAPGAVVAVVGPVDEAEARSAIGPVGTDPSNRPRATALAWREGDRLSLRREVTNAWIGAAFPAPPQLPRTDLELVAFELEEALNPSPPDPGVFSASVLIEDTPRGPVVVAQAAVVPEVVNDWERRILNSLDEFATETDEDFFRWRRRRFRSAVLLRDGAPEEASLRQALDLLRDGSVRPLGEQTWEVMPSNLARAAAALGEPRVILMGPDLPDP